ncbi:16S rRNA (cytosine(967)-C(5))-methyltransferase RsmB [Candidatus Enterovibrio altilux]|uniref:16S rRNA (cytosine(967)-C(5))-methyltransferase RsmB n=1 Tax=Candidatus Enterovibrio altilux TaxID=1927128 RepID=UPI0012381F03|nr:16S rRNA (cytosine(967)-C(5))-methyltransferase RsmB [Candidatus Enterovibrio luxaltus]
MNVRAVAAQVIYQVVDQGQSLTVVLPSAQQKILPRDGALLQEICYGVLRWLPRLESITQSLMNKPLKGKQRVFHHLILVGLYQMAFMRIPLYAIVAETVNATKVLKKPQLHGLVNAVLRSYQRNQKILDTAAVTHASGKYNHPDWLLALLQNAYPTQWEQVVEANHAKAPMWLRINRVHNTRDSYRTLLTANGTETYTHSEANDALMLASPCGVLELPGFADGLVSVQDAAAQLAINYLNPQSGELILDCCAAPGGKTCHILEHQNGVKVIAMDVDSTRLTRIKENLTRLKLKAQVICGDARYPTDCWHGEQFDRILLDAPCSATGIIRRHPDIKWLRCADDISRLVSLQSEILDAMWAQLKPGGTLVYATCSIAPQENGEQIAAFLARTNNATLKIGTPDAPGRQIISGQENMDGFYYATISKTL